MATAQNTGINSLTKVLESICRERRREHLDKESEGMFEVPRLTWSSLKLIDNWILVIRAINFDWVLPREIYASKIYHSECLWLSGNAIFLLMIVLFVGRYFCK